MNHANFADFFSALWGEQATPFAWQSALVRRVLDASRDPAATSANDPTPADTCGSRPWPDAIALPTGAGKTACLDIAVFALAAQSLHVGSARAMTAPRRIFFVVDRRIIVDEAHDRARRLASKLEAAEGGILKTVADRLRRLAGGGATKLDSERPLAVHSLRGGMYRSEAWARNPLQPTIVASTVDQIGSRLLFRAYGRGAGSWPIYAGLIANDTLILLDEAHCAQPFLQTLRAVAKLRTWAEAPLGRAFHPVVMSATPPPVAKDVFRDLSGEGRDPSHLLGRRQLASKPASLRIAAKAKGENATRELGKELAGAARCLLGDGRRAIVIFANRVATARETERLLQDPDVETVLLTGRMRAVDRDAVAARLKGLDLYSDRSIHRNLEKPVIVVATQTLEVGADLDFDGLVTECASLDALRQRFGRLNRMGRGVRNRGVIVIRADQASSKRGEEDDPIYGKALTATWKWLDDGKDGDDAVDFGIAAMSERLEGQSDLTEFNAPTASAPVLLPAHVDCWAQTAPVPRPSPDVAPFLRGPRRGVPDVQVCWRADLDLSDGEGQDRAVETLALCPPSSGETLPVPIGVFRRWLAGAEDAEDRSTDVLHADELDGDDAQSAVERRAGAEAARRIVRWRGARTGREDITATPVDVCPGDVIVIPTIHPRSWNRLGDLPLDATGTADALDVADPSHRVARAKPILRLHPALVSAWPDTLSVKQDALALLEGLDQRYEEDPEEITNALQDLLEGLRVSETPTGWLWLREAAGELADEFSEAGRLRHGYRIIGGRSLILVGRRRIRKLAGEADAFSDEDDASASGTSHRNGKPVPLRTHLPGVEKFARRHAVGCDLPDPLAEAVARAGLLHDLGKADPRFQSLLRGGSPWLVGETLAKSAQMPKTPTARRRAREAAGYPEGARHELLSVRLAESAPALLPPDDGLRDLVLHLVASHHGHCRPFAPVVLEDETPPVELKLRGHRTHWSGPTGLERLDSGVADRYWRLTRRYGWWGLAWLEALLRLADWRRSEWEEAHDAEE